MKLSILRKILFGSVMLWISILNVQGGGSALYYKAEEKLRKWGIFSALTYLQTLEKEYELHPFGKSNYVAGQQEGSKDIYFSQVWQEKKRSGLRLTQAFQKDGKITLLYTTAPMYFDGSPDCLHQTGKEKYYKDNVYSRRVPCSQCMVESGKQVFPCGIVTRTLPIKEGGATCEEIQETIQELFHYSDRLLISKNYCEKSKNLKTILDEMAKEEDRLSKNMSAWMQHAVNFFGIHVDKNRLFQDEERLFAQYSHDFFINISKNFDYIAFNAQDFQDIKKQIVAITGKNHKNVSAPYFLDIPISVRVALSLYREIEDELKERLSRSLIKYFKNYYKIEKNKNMKIDLNDLFYFVCHRKKIEDQSPSPSKEAQPNLLESSKIQLTVDISKKPDGKFDIDFWRGILFFLRDHASLLETLPLKSDSILCLSDLIESLKPHSKNLDFNFRSLMQAHDPESYNQTNFKEVLCFKLMTHFSGCLEDYADRQKNIYNSTHWWNVYNYWRSDFEKTTDAEKFLSLLVGAYNFQKDVKEDSYTDSFGYEYQRERDFREYPPEIEKRNQKKISVLEIAAPRLSPIRVGDAFQKTWGVPLHVFSLDSREENFDKLYEFTQEVKIGDRLFVQALDFSQLSDGLYLFRLADVKEVSGSFVCTYLTQPLYTAYLEECVSYDGASAKGPFSQRFNGSFLCDNPYCSCNETSSVRCGILSYSYKPTQSSKMTLENLKKEYMNFLISYSSKFIKVECFMKSKGSNDWMLFPFGLEIFDEIDEKKLSSQELSLFKEYEKEFFKRIAEGFLKSSDDSSDCSGFFSNVDKYLSKLSKSETREYYFQIFHRSLSGALFYYKEKRKNFYYEEKRKKDLDFVMSRVCEIADKPKSSGADMCLEKNSLIGLFLFITDCCKKIMDKHAISYECSVIEDKSLFFGFMKLLSENINHMKKIHINDLVKEKIFENIRDAFLVIADSVEYDLFYFRSEWMLDPVMKESLSKISLKEKSNPLEKDSEITLQDMLCLTIASKCPTFAKQNRGYLDSLFSVIPLDPVKEVIGGYIAAFRHHQATKKVGQYYSYVGDEDTPPEMKHPNSPRRDMFREAGMNITRKYY